MAFLAPIFQSNISLKDSDISAFPVSLTSVVSRHQNINEEESERESEVFLPIHLSPLYSPGLQKSERSRNSSLTAHAGSQSHLNTSLSCLNIKVGASLPQLTNYTMILLQSPQSIESKLCSSNMSLRSPVEKRGTVLNTRQKALLSGVLNRSDDT